MSRIVQEIPDGAVLVDCITRIKTLDMARALKADGVDGVIQYVGRMGKDDPGLLPEHVDNILVAGMGFFGVCYADDFAGAARARDYAAAGAMPGLTLGTDLESYHLSAALCIHSLEAAYRDIHAAEFLPCLYNGAGHPLTGEPLGRLSFEHYWRSLSTSVPMPTLNGQPIGYALIQEFGDPRDPRVNWRRVMRGGINVDVNTAHADFKGRRLTWMIDDRSIPTVPELPPLPEEA